MSFNTYLLPQTTAYLAQCTTQPSAKWTNALNTLIRQLIIDGNWQLLDRMWIFATESRSNAVLSIVKPGSATSVSEENSSNLTWTANQGYTGDGSSSYLNSNYSPSGNFATNSNSLGVYSRTNTSNASPTNTYDIGSTDGTDYVVLSCGVVSTPPTLGAILYDNITAASSFAAAVVSDTYALIAGVRATASSQAIYKRGTALTLQQGGSTSSNGMPSVVFTILATNVNGTPGFFSVRQTSMAFVGSGNINQSKLYIAFQAFATTIGFAV